MGLARSGPAIRAVAGVRGDDDRVILVGVFVALQLGAFTRRDGRILFVGIALWAFARAAVATSWRDESVLAGLNMGSLIAIAVGLGCLIVVAVMTARSRRSASGEPGAGATGPGGSSTDGPPASPGPGDGGSTSWPDPSSRPRF